MTITFSSIGFPRLQLGHINACSVHSFAHPHHFLLRRCLSIAAGPHQRLFCSFIRSPSSHSLASLSFNCSWATSTLGSSSTSRDSSQHRLPGPSCWHPSPFTLSLTHKCREISHQAGSPCDGIKTSTPALVKTPQQLKRNPPTLPCSPSPCLFRQARRCTWCCPLQSL